MTRATYLAAAPCLALLLAAPDAGARRHPLTLVAVGDVGFNRSNRKVYPDGMRLWARERVPFGAMLRDKTIRAQINGDIRFLNLETVVTDRNDIQPEDKKYRFRSHPNALGALLRAGKGFNLVSIANNHVRDYGAAGIAETRKWLRRYNRKKKRFWFAGAGKDIAQASRATVMKLRGGRVKVAFAAVSIGPVATAKRAGVSPTYRPHALKALEQAQAHIRILSMHAGSEGKLKPAGYQRSLARRAIRDHKVDIVIGHHPHVVQGIERYGGGLIFYSLGNFALRGARDMGRAKKHRIKRDYGLLVKLLMVWDARKGRLQLRSLEALPVYDMHSGPHPFKEPARAWARIQFLNSLSARLATEKNPKVIFQRRKGRFIVPLLAGPQLR